MSVKILLYTLLKQIGIFLVVSFLVFRGTFVESDSLGLNLSTGVSLLLSVILWGIINLHTYWLIPGYLFQRRYKKYIIYLSCLVGFMLTAMVGAICFLGQYYVIPEQMQRLKVISFLSVDKCIGTDTLFPGFFLLLFFCIVGTISTTIK